MGWFSKRESSVKIAPGAVKVENKPAAKTPPKLEQQHEKEILKDQYTDRKAQQDIATKHAGLFGGYRETPFTLTGARQHQHQIWQVSTQVYDLAPGYAIAEPDSPDNPDAIRVEAFGHTVGYVPKAKCKRIRNMGDRVPVLVILDHNSSPMKIEVAVRGIM
jgi:hypothetical protein